MFDLLLENKLVGGWGLCLAYIGITGPYTSLPAAKNLLSTLSFSPFLSLKEDGRLSIATTLIMKEIREGQR